MISHIQLARQAEYENNPINALSHYLKAIEGQEVLDIEDWLNAGVLFFIAQDYGFSHYYKLAREEQSKYWDQCLVCLSKAEKHTEAFFWKRYIPYISTGAGEPLSNEELKRMMLSDPIASIALISEDSSESVLSNARILFERHTPAISARSWYIHSIIDHHLIPKVRNSEERSKNRRIKGENRKKRMGQ